MIAVADEIASAAELVMGKLAGVPAAVVRGLEVRGLGSARELVMPPRRELSFRYGARATLSHSLLRSRFFSSGFRGCR